MRVFLSGYIAPDRKYLEWRGEAANLLALLGIDTVDVVLGVDPSKWDHAGLTDPMTPPAFMVAADLHKLERSDAVLLYAAGNLPRQSIGTWFEFGWAVQARKPVVVVTTDRTVEAHPFIQRFASAICPTVQEGVEWLARLL